MANLIDSIPVYKPQNTVVVPQGNAVTSLTNNPFPQIKKYEYLPAKPLSPARTTPKGVKPQAASGYLIKENIFQSSKNTIKSYGDYVKYFFNAAFKGEGTDYSVGKINDLAIRVGSLGIASYLAASKMFPFAKGMEFIGLGTWFASMALWPKILSLPIKAKTGVDINQEYIDSYGRRKFVYEDNQYRPMDLFRHVDLKGRPLSEKEYYKKYKEDYVYFDRVGEKLGVPKDIKNYNEATFNKMGQVAVQGKTISMITAGVMTPVLSSIVADALQGPYKNFLENYRYNKAEKEIDKINATVQKLLDFEKPFGQRKIETNVETIIKELGLVIPESSEKEFMSNLLRDCELMPVEFERLKGYITQNNSRGTSFHTYIKEAIDAAVVENGVVKLPKEKMYSVLTSMNKGDLNNVEQQLKNELEFLLTRSQKLNKKQLEALEAFIKNRFVGSGFMDVWNEAIRGGINYTEHHVTLCDSLRDGLIETTEKAVKEAISQMDKAFAETLPQEIKNYAGISEHEYKEIIRRSMNDGAREMNTLQNHAFENMAKRISIKRFAHLNVEPDAIDLITESIHKNIKAYMESQRHYIIPHDKMRELYRFVEANTQLLRKIKTFEATSIKNIAESITANSWEKLPIKYFEALKFTKEELTQIATMDTSYANNVVARKLEQIVANPQAYNEVLQKMSTLAKTAITKEEKAVIKLIGTADTPGVLSNVKDLMSTVGSNNFGQRVYESVTAFYRSRIADIQNKFRNTVDSFVRPIKALDTFRNIEQTVENILGKTPLEYSNKVYGHNDLKIAKNPHYHMFEGLSYEEAKKGLTKFIKDIVLDKNDINNWTTKFEHNIPGSKRGLKYSLEIVQKIADAVNGSLGQEVTLAVGDEFAKICNNNNAIMRYRFLALESKLAKNFSDNTCYMRNYAPAEQLVREICSGNFKNLHILEVLIDERKAELTLEQISNLKNLRDTARKGYNYIIQNEEEFRNKILRPLDFFTDNKSVSEMTGKGVTEFFKNAAECIRARNKWAKLAYGLLIGTVGVTGILIATIGKKNFFNKDIYETKNS